MEGCNELRVNTCSDDEQLYLPAGKCIPNKEVKGAKLVFDTNEDLSLQLLDENNTPFIYSNKVNLPFKEINNKISNRASSTNKVPSNDEVMEAINSVTAYPIFKDANQNNFSTKSELDNATEFYGGNGEVRELTQNDYTYILDDETHDGNLARYIYVDNEWVFQISMSSMAFTQEQLDALNSGITDEILQNLINGLGNTYTKAEDDELLDAKQDNLTQDRGIKIDNNNNIYFDDEIFISKEFRVTLPAKNAGEYYIHNFTNDVVDFENSNNCKRFIVEQAMVTASGTVCNMNNFEFTVNGSVQAGVYYLKNLTTTSYQIRMSIKFIKNRG